MNQAILETLEQITENEEERDGASGETVGFLEDDSIQAVKVKKPRTQKQIDAFKGVCEKRKLAREERIVKRNEVAIEDKKILDAKIIKKAINITKRKIQEERILEDTDNTDDQPKKSLVKTIVPKIIVPPKLEILFI